MPTFNGTAVNEKSTPPNVSAGTLGSHPAFFLTSRTLGRRRAR
jgi:hypothetical protein